MRSDLPLQLEAYATLLAVADPHRLNPEPMEVARIARERVPRPAKTQNS